MISNKGLVCLMFDWGSVWTGMMQGRKIKIGERKEKEFKKMEWEKKMLKKRMLKEDWNRMRKRKRDVWGWSWKF